MQQERSTDSGGEEFLRGEHDWKPTPHGALLAAALGDADLVRDRDILELGGGVANHTVLLARAGARSIVVTEICEQFLETTRRNFTHHHPEYRAIEYRVADWLQTSGSFDLVVTNPPFCKSGKQNRRYFIDSLILDGHKRLRPEGRLLFVQSSMADLTMSRRRLDQNGFDSRIVTQARGTFRDYYFEDESFMREIRDVPGGYEVVDGTYYETLTVIEATLRPFTPPAGAHLAPPGAG